MVVSRISIRLNVLRNKKMIGVMKNEKISTTLNTTSHHEPVAIVGMACRFPQANSLQEFWDLLIHGKSTVTEIPAERWNVADYFDPDPSTQDKTHQRHASLLTNIHDFDPLFFTISPAEATEMNPSQKLMLELVWEAIENSTMPFRKVGRKTGVYVGNIWNDFEHLRKHKNAPVTSHSAIGQSSNIIANRISYVYGFTGPSLVVDTGCSSSLVALHLACQSLWDESTEMSVVAGVNHILDPDQYILLSKFGGLSAKGQCSTFDADADGFVRGEGAGVLLLKRLSQAEQDGDRIYALIRGTSVNNNGYNVSLPATSVAGQKQVLQDAYAHSGIEPHEVHYIEAHGTGTRLGDPTEARALGEFFREGRNHKLHIGSVKTNVGHLEAAAGIAGLIKVVLAMQHRQLPPSLNYKTPNPDIPLDELNLHVQHEAGAWPCHNGESLKAGINSFGWGGTNAHTILEEYRPVFDRRQALPQVHRCCLPLSARSSGALKAYAKAYSNLLAETSPELFPEICVATALLKPAFDHRMLFSANGKEEVINMLKEFAEDPDEIIPHKPLAGNDKIVMIFPGQGSQWMGMGRELYRQEPVFRFAMDACDQAFKAYTDWSLIQQLHASADDNLLQEINIIQPMLCAIQIAVAKLWMSWGIQPHAVAGHSMGEIAAAFISGALDLDDAARIICTRSRLMRAVSGQGGVMAVTELSLNEAHALTQRYHQVSVAVNNSPRSTVLAGDQEIIGQVMAELESRNLFCRKVKVDVASHSGQMDPLKEELYQSLQGIKPKPTIIPLYSTVKSKVMTGEDMQAGYWADNLRSTVQFATVMEKMIHHGHTVFIEVSPHPVLINAIKECAESLQQPVITIASLYREKPEQESLYKNLGELYAHGYDVNWENYYQTDKAPVVQLPAYPFQRERYALEDRSHEAENKKKNTGFPLLGNTLHLAGTEDVFFWETTISLNTFPYLKDHQVNESPVLPAAAYVEMILEASGELYGKAIPAINRMKFIKPLNLSSGETCTLQLKLKQEGKIDTVRFFANVIPAPGKPVWELMAEGELTINQPGQDTVAGILDAGRSSEIASTAYYEFLRSLGLYYGPCFQGLREIRRCEPDEVRFSIHPHEHIRSISGHYKVHPALLDACFQPVFLSLFKDSPALDAKLTTFLTGIREVCFHGAIDHATELKGMATLHAMKKDVQRGFVDVEADIAIYSKGLPVLSMKGLQGRIIDAHLADRQKEKLRSWLYKVNWIKLMEERPLPVNGRCGKGAWVIMGDPYGVSNILEEKMSVQGISSIHVLPGDRFCRTGDTRYTINYRSESNYASLVQALFSPGERKIEGIIHAASMNYTWQDPFLTTDAVEAHQPYGSASLLCLQRQLAIRRPAAIPRLVIITNGIQPVGQGENASQPLHSPLWGLSKVVFNELNHYNSRYFDLSAMPAMEELEQVITEILSPDSRENEIAFRGVDRYVPRLCRGQSEEDLSCQHEQFSPHGTYLVTGFRGVGFAFIEWMIAQGARHFALVSRTGEATPEVQERIDVLRSQGCRFKIFRADAGNYQALSTVFGEIDLSMPPLKGVIHAAGVIEARSLTDLRVEEFLRILNPKVRGAWNLHLLTQHRVLDCFIMFSSASALIGLSGQGSYVAANAFLDTLAHNRRRKGLPAMSINWGVIRDVGMVANEAALEKYARAEGLEPVNAKDAIEVFGAIYHSAPVQMGVLKLHLASVARYYRALSQTNYFKDLLVKTAAPDKKEASLLEDLLSQPSSAGRIRLLEQLVAQHAARIVKTPASRIKSNMTFKGLGIDSLMAIQLRNLLENDLGLKLSVAMFWSYPSIGEYASFLQTTLSQQAPVETTPVPAIHRWFVIPDPKPGASFRLFCFHDAGGSTSLFHPWKTLLDDTAELVMVELPGRGKRVSEKPYTDMASLVRDLTMAVTTMTDKPFIFFGHSMGGLIAFEVARALRKDHQKIPVRLFFSSTPELTTYSARDIDPAQSDEALTRVFPHLDKRAMPDEELRQLLLNLLRADLLLIKNYRYTKQEPLDIPFTVLYGENDSRVREEQAEKWRTETLSTCAVIRRPGGHRFIERDAEFIVSLISEEASLVAITYV
jgi:acyl transferase domain-containing protein/surfactin synthase thioesterase subunit/acyl carrier protein/short-subunit dehydrogenase